MTGMVEERENLLAVETDRLNEALRQANVTIDTEIERGERVRNVGTRIASVAAERVMSSPMDPEVLETATVLLMIALNIEQASRDIPLDPEPGKYL